MLTLETLMVTPCGSILDKVQYIRQLRSNLPAPKKCDLDQKHGLILSLSISLCVDLVL